jgi:hypothetical protein
MRLLEELYLAKFHLPRNFKKRKSFIPLTNCIVSGVKNSGKTFLVYELLDSIETQNFLYIDFDDIRLDLEQLESLDKFISNKKIEIVILENFENQINLPQNTINIITTTKKIIIDGYENISIYPLDFEEFISFENKTHSIKYSFNDFLKSSMFPKNINLQMQEQVISLQNDIKLISNNILKEQIFRILISSVGLKLSLLQIFKKLKSIIKVSKDKFYEIVKEFEDNGYIFLISKHNQIRSSKKIYIIDTYFKSAISFEKNFQLYYENFVFLQLVRSGLEIFYTDLINFYIPSKNMAIISKAFFDIDMIDDKMNKIRKHLKELNIETLYIVTTSDDHETLNIHDIEVIVIPFWEWALI